MRIHDTSAKDGSGILWLQFELVMETELAGGHVRITQTSKVSGAWRFETSGVYFVTEMDMAVNALQLARNLTQAIDSNPAGYQKILAMANAGIAKGV